VTRFPWRLIQLSAVTGREEHVGPDVIFPLVMTGSHLRGLEPSQLHQPKGWSLIGTVKQEVICCTETTNLLFVVSVLFSNLLEFFFSFPEFMKVFLKGLVRICKVHLFWLQYVVIVSFL